MKIFIHEFVNLLLMLKISLNIFSLFAFFLLVPNISYADEKKPTDTVRELLGAISLIKDESLIKLTPDEKKNNEKLIKKANSLIHISILGPKTLGSYWKKKTSEEKKTFLSLLTSLFEKVAYPKSGKFFIDLKITYNNETVKKGKAEVRTSMEHEDEGLIEIDYKLHKVNGNWLIYDVILDEVSLSTNLKTKFQQLIQKESFDELINRMTKRLKRED